MLQGYVYDRPYAGTLPAYHWFSAALGDNLETTDPRWENTGSNPRSGYGLGNIQGYVLPPANPQKPETAENFHFAAKAPPTSSALSGERPAVMFMLNYTDQPFRHSTNHFDNWLFGPGFPNASDYIRENSQFVFNWGRGGVIPVTMPDDTVTTGNESLWRDNWDPEHEDFLFLSLAAPNGRLFSAINAGGSGIGWAGAYQVWEQLALVDFNGGHLMSGDVVSFKTVGDYYFRENVGLLTADTTSVGSPSARFFVSKSGGGQIRKGDRISLQCVSNGRYVQATGGGGGTLTTTAFTPGANGLFAIGKGWPVQGSLLRRAAREAARLGRFNPATYDRDHDGHLTSLEMTTVVLESSPPHDTDGGAQTTFSGAFTVPGSTVSVELNSVTATGEDVSFGTLVHEMTHQLGAVDLYGPCCMSGDFTIMSCTAGVPASSTKIYNLDPWHRMMFGWTEPLIRMVRQPAMSDRLTTLDLASLADKRPVLLYDPARYNLETKTGEYLLLEYRTRSYSTNRYDRNIYTEGLAAWYVKTLGNGNLGSTVVPCGVADQATFVLGQPDSRPGDGQMWTSSNGRFALRWPDGTPVPLTFEVAAGPYNRPTLDVEWSPSEGFLPRLDSAHVTSSSPCFLLAIDGMFPIRAAVDDTVTLVRGATRIPCRVRSWDARRIVCEVPSGTTAGSYEVEIRNGTLIGNRVPWTLDATVTTSPGVFEFARMASSVDEFAGVATLRVDRLLGACGEASVRYTTSSLTAIAPADFVMVDGVLTFAEGETSKTFTVPIVNDLLNEDLETLRLTLSNPTGGATLGAVTLAALDIIDEDPMPSVSVGDVSITEGDTSSVFADIPFTLSAPSGRTVGVGYSTPAETASAGVDYRPNEEAIVFPAGTTRVTRRVEILPDRLNEDNETFAVRLRFPINVGLGRETAQITLVDNDPMPTLTINDLIVTEGDEGTQHPVFTVRLSAPSGRPVQIRGATVNGSALGGEDYTGVSLPPTTLAPGETTALVQMHIAGTPGHEPDETFYFRLSGPVNATLADAEGACTIKELRFSSFRREDADMVFAFPTGNTGVHYHVERADALRGPSTIWTPVTPAGGIVGTGDIVIVRDVGALTRGGNASYRIRQE
jgi:M6 family metalloprotease-like protein